MPSAEIVFIATSQDLEGIAGEVVLEMGESVEVVRGNLTAGARIAADAATLGAGAIISRGSTAAAIRESGLAIPTVEVQVTGYDAARALHEAQRFGGTVGVVGHPQMIRWVDGMASLLGVRALKREASSPESNVAAVEELIAFGVDAVVGGNLAVRHAREKGLPTVVLRSGREAVTEAIHGARLAIEARRLERVRAEMLHAILATVRNGVVAVDSAGRVTLFNPVAQRMTGLRAEDVIGRPVSVAIHDQRLHPIIQGDEAERGELQKIGAFTVLVNKLPIMVDGEVKGAVASLEDVTRIQELERQIRQELNARGHVAKYTFEDVVGQSRAIKDAVRRARSFADTRSTILIEAETGTGKEVFAQSIHSASPVATGPFVAVNCAALPESLLESELFGYAPGAFTGARQTGKPGLFEMARGGTIFLDEVAETSTAVQARLLRVLQEREVMRVGDYRVTPVDVRVIAGSNRDVTAMVESGKFREDLFYRLNILHLRIPPLRERREDISVLIEHFLREAAERLGKPIRLMSPATVEAFVGYDWPGNVRQLENAAEQLTALGGSEQIEVGEVLEIIGRSAGSSGGGTGYRFGARRNLKEIEDAAILQALEETGWNKAAAARLLGISKATMWRRLRRLATDGLRNGPAAE